MEAALQAIAELETAAEEQLDKLSSDIAKCTRQLRSDREKLFKRRQELVSGKGQPPTHEELQDADDGHGAPDAAQHSSKGVPYFWLTALCNQDTLAGEISSRDKRALSYCTGVRAAYPSGGGPATLEMSFAANPFFSNSVLRRRLEDGGEGGGGSGGEVSTDIEWKDSAHKLTVREVVKKGGKRGKGKSGKGKGGKGRGAGEDEDEEEPAAAKVTYKPCASFFSFFLPDPRASRGRRHHLHDPTLPHTVDLSDDEDEEEAERSAKQERDELIMAALLDELLPRAAALYLDGPLQAPSDEDDDEGDFQLVHGAVGGSPADLPGPVQRVLAALRHNQGQLDALAADCQRQRSKLKVQQSALRAKLAQQRRALLLPAGASEAAVPRFWLRVLRSADAAALAISPRDAAVLASLADVRFALDSSEDGSELHGRLELEFLPNPYLAAPSDGGSGSSGGTVLLAKAYSFQPQPGGVRMLQSKVAAAPKWAAPERDPTHKRGRDGKQRPAVSLFQLFKPGGGKWLFNLTGDPKDVQAEANELETELLQELHGHLLLQAGHVYRDAAKEGSWHDDDDDAAAWAAVAAEADADSEDDEEGDDEEGDDEGEAAHKAAVRRSKAAKQGGWRPTKAGLLLMLLGMVLFGELLMFLDMVFRRR